MVEVETKNTQLHGSRVSTGVRRSLTETGEERSEIDPVSIQNKVRNLRCLRFLYGVEV